MSFIWNHKEKQIDFYKVCLIKNVSTSKWVNATTFSRIFGFLFYIKAWSYFGTPIC